VKGGHTKNVETKLDKKRGKRGDKIEKHVDSEKGGI